MSKKRVTSILLICTFFVSLYPAIERTYDLASDTHGLIIFSSFKEGQTTLNPYSKNGVMLTPGIALWLVENTEYHYGQCTTDFRIRNGVCKEPLVSYAGRGVDDVINMDKKTSFRLVKFFIARGEPINILSPFGMAPIHEAALYGNKEYFTLLLNSGADPSIRIENPDKKWDGMNLIEFVEHLESNNPGKYKEFIELLRL